MNVQDTYVISYALCNGTPALYLGNHATNPLFVSCGMHLAQQEWKKYNDTVKPDADPVLLSTLMSRDEHTQDTFLKNILAQLPHFHMRAESALYKHLSATLDGVVINTCTNTSTFQVSSRGARRTRADTQPADTIRPMAPRIIVHPDDYWF